MSHTFIELGEYNGKGLCQIVSSLIMLGLSAKQSRIVRGFVGEAPAFFHSWVEVKYLGEWFCVDPVLYYSHTIPRQLFYSQLNPKEKFSCNHQTFFSYPDVQQLADRLKNAASSYHLPEIMKAFYASKSTYGFSGIDNLSQQLHDFDGTSFVDLVLDRVITQEIFDRTLEPKTSA